MKNICQYLLTIALLFFAGEALAQNYNVSGRVINKNGEPLKGATVFIGGSERIMATDENGRFNFAHVPPGSFQLSAQMIGYSPVTRAVVIKNASLTIDLKLETKAVALAQVNIGKKSAWKRNFDLFKKEFLGQTANARQCVILNPQIINFSTKKGLLMADADDFLVIENKRLGYRVHYLLQDFG
ncbi:MAG TPA: carboxypeptidase-like regulatory domain-containing protein, partial [Mucilaginibacter sp.]|nr:carboxypeptidase-like regulatory domain-containing protein [Mucilaginibacter sp.]